MKTLNHKSAVLLLELAVPALIMFVLLFPGESILAQGCGGMGHGGGHGGGHGDAHKQAAEPSIAPVWSSVMFSHTGLHKAVASMSIPDAAYYGGLMRDDFKSLKANAREMKIGMDRPLSAAVSRVSQLTKQIPKHLKVGDQEAAMSDLEYIEIEIGRVVAIFPESLVPDDFAAQFVLADSLETVAGAEDTDGVTTTATQFVCPMHPSIVYSAAGDCPLCGMALVEKK